MIFKKDISKTLLLLHLLFVIPAVVLSQIPDSLVNKYITVNRTKSSEKFVWTQEQTVIVDNLKDFTQGTTEYSPYGGIMCTQYPATGYIYTLKVKDRWWFVDPDGHLMIHKGINQLRHVNDQYSPFENMADWQATTMPLLKDIGINGAGGWSLARKINGTPHKLVHIEPLKLISNFHTEAYGTYDHKGLENGVMPVFHANWSSFVGAKVSDAAAIHIDDPYFLGIFCGNEQYFKFDALTRFLNLKYNDPGYLFALDWLRQRKNDQNATIADVTTADEEAFFEVYVDAYYKPISDAVKLHMPNHLYLGSRVYQKELVTHEKFITIYGKYVDVMSFNRYSAVWTEKKELMDSWQTWGKKPFIVTEFYAKGETTLQHNDASGNPIVTNFSNISGAGQVVATQKERGYFYQNITMSWLQHKSCIGWHWFTYRDQDHTVDPEASNKGIVDLWYNPYTELTDLMKQVNTQDYRLIEYFDNTTYCDNVLSSDNETKLLNENTVKIYPNPANDHVIIDLDNFYVLDGSQIKIYSIFGQQVFQTIVNSQQIYVDTKNWGASGIYFITIINTKGEGIETRKIIKR